MSTGIGEDITLRLREEIQRLGFSQAKVAALAGEKTPHRIKAVLSGRQKCPPDLLGALTEIGVDTIYVLTGRQDGNLALAASDSSGIDVPVYDIEAAAGHGTPLDSENVAYTFPVPSEFLGEHGLNPDQCIMLTVRGDSMEPTLFDGDVVLVDRSVTKPDGVFLISSGGELRVKRVQRAAGGAYILISDNTRYREELIPPTALDTISLLGKCVLKISSVS